MKRKINFKIKAVFISLCVVIILCLFSSCEKFVNVELPNTQLTMETVFEDVSTAKSALANIYIQLRDQVLVTGVSYKGLNTLLGNYADEITYYNNSNNSEMEFFLNSLIPTNTVIANVWNDSYNLIYAINALIEGVSKSANILVQDKDLIQGEALFVRAYIHFYLLNLYGEIPYITTTDYRLNSTVSKMAKEDVYVAIIADLEKAKTLLSDTYPSAERVRPNRSVVTALLARVYLYVEDWEAAESEADEVIENSQYIWVNDLENIFLNTSSGTLWQLMSSDAGLNTIEAQTFIIFAGPPTNYALSNELVEAFETGDLRKTHWLGSVSSGSNTWYFPYKYKQTTSTPISQEYSILFRLGEQYLIRAEARAKQNNINGAKEDLNKIRNRAGLDDTSAETDSQLLQAILQERRVELFTEHGHRFFDLKRTGQIDAALSGVKPGWNSTDILWPLPESELLLNTNLNPQNPGYN